MGKKIGGRFVEPKNRSTPVILTGERNNKGDGTAQLVNFKFASITTGKRAQFLVERLR